MGDHVVGAAVIVFPHRLVDFGYVLDGARNRCQYVNLPRCNTLLHLRKLARCIEVCAANLGTGHEDSALSHPDLWRVKRETATAELLAVHHATDIGFD